MTSYDHNVSLKGIHHPNIVWESLIQLTSRIMSKSYFCNHQKAQISSVSTQVEQSLCFFATLIGNLPALIEKSQKILNPKLKDYCLFLHLHGRKLADLERELQRNVF